jgi:hypothetical protein
MRGSPSAHTGRRGSANALKREIAVLVAPQAPRPGPARTRSNQHRRHEAPVLTPACEVELEDRELPTPPALGEEVSVHIDRELCAASEQSLLERLRGVEDGVESGWSSGTTRCSSGSCSASPAAARGAPQSRTSIRWERFTVDGSSLIATERGTNRIAAIRSTSASQKTLPSSTPGRLS